MPEPLDLTTEFLTKYRQLAKQKGDLEHEVGHLRAELEQAIQSSSSAREIDELKAKLARLEEERDRLRAEKLTFTKRNDDLEQHLGIACARNTEESERLGHIKGNLARLEEERDRLRGENLTLSKRIDDMEQHLGIAHARNTDESEKLGRRIKVLEKERDELRDRIDRLTRERERAPREPQVPPEDVTTLRAKLADCQRRLDDASADLEKALGENLDLRKRLYAYQERE